MLIVITAPTSLPVTVADLKEHALIEHDEQGAAIARMIRAASDYVGRVNGRILAPSTFRLTCEGFGHCIELPVAPLREVRAVMYRDEADVEHTIAEAGYVLQLTPDGGRVVFKPDYSFPASLSRLPDPVWVEFDAGFDDPDLTGAGDDPRLVLPEGLALAVLMLAATWFDHREECESNEQYMLELGARCLASQGRIFR